MGIFCNSQSKRYFIITLIEKLIAIQLSGPLSSNGTGRVEVFYNGKWGTICDRGWDTNAAKVVCGELGYTHGARSLQGRYVTDGTGQIWLSEVNCTGRERSLSSCLHSGWANNFCDHRHDAGVECFQTGN